MRSLTISDPGLIIPRARLVNSWDVGTSVSGWSGTAWTPTSGWAQATGSAYGQPVMRRDAGLGTHLGYLEFDFYQAGSGDWTMFALCWGTDASAYSDNGYSWLIRGPSTSSPNMMTGIAKTSGTNYTISPPPSSSGAAVRIGLEVTGTQTTVAYVNRVAVASATHTSNHSAKRNVAFGVHNGVTGCIDNVEVFDRRPF